ncbi:MBL fold metallo-hydrolase [Armatimonas sp.]|uniref:MBL fold metallo-hydrolase n=1 Tax=Armatimonas sp. TaxID=1872638 RepID=UPI00286C9368|nr:MBL fold metallo-hydrolase [Armatimonas sp.]
MGGRLSLGFVNVYFLDDGEPGGEWALIDTGLPWHFSAIVREARRRYGKTRPTGIYLTHGHYDHAGSAAALAAYWNVPVFAHEAELPFLTGQCDYPPADPSSCGGWLSLASRFASTHGKDLRPFVQALPPQPPLPITGGGEWAWIPLPGHTPGQVGFWHEESRTLIAGDALMNLSLDSWRPRAGLSWPPQPFTTDWFAVRKSLEKIVALRPEALCFGHGEPISDPSLADQLADRTQYFAIARKGRYIGEPVRHAADGSPIVAPATRDPGKKIAKAIALGALATGALYFLKNKQNS